MNTARAYKISKSVRIYLGDTAILNQKHLYKYESYLSVHDDYLPIVVSLFVSSE